MDFQKAERKFKQLKAGFEVGKLTEAEFKSQLEELMVQDEAGSWWMIGYETEQWYRHDGKDWVQTDPPGIPSKKTTPVVTPEPQTDEDVSAKIAAQENGRHEVTEKTFRDKFEREEKKPKGKPSYWKAIGFHLLFGFGLFYVNKEAKRRWVYPAVFFYALIDVILGPGLEVSPFDDDFGFYTFLTALGIYVLSIIDIIITCKNRRRFNR